MTTERLSVYDLRSKRRALAGEAVLSKTEPNNKLKITAEGIGRDVLIGVLGGGLAAALLGKYSFILGLGVAGFGHYSENKALSALGLGMMASGTFMALTGNKQQEKKTSSEKIKERLEIFKEELKQKFFLDKILADKEVTAKQKEESKAEKKEDANANSKQNPVDDNLAGTKKKPVQQEPIPASEMERIKKEAEEEAEKEFIIYQEEQKKKAEAESKVRADFQKENKKNEKTGTDKKLENELRDLKTKETLF